MNFLPSKKFTLTASSIILVIILISTGYYLATKKTSQSDTANKNLNSHLSSLVSDNIQKDSDNDGLPDWEETLWKTNPNKPDTDNDGTSDGNEVAARRDPLKPNTAKPGEIPNDFLDNSGSTNASSTSKTATTTEDTNEKMAGEFFSKYFAMNGGKQPLSDESKNDLMQSVISDNFNPSQFTFKSYTLKDVQIISGQITPASKNVYLSSISQVFKNDNFRLDFNEAQIIQKAVGAQDETILKQTDTVITKYNKVISDLLKIPVPASLVQNHLSIVNSLYGIVQCIPIMRKGYQEPLYLLNVLVPYQNYTTSLLNSLDFLSK